MRKGGGKVNCGVKLWCEGDGKRKGKREGRGENVDLLTALNGEQRGGLCISLRICTGWASTPLDPSSARSGTRVIVPPCRDLGDYLPDTNRLVCLKNNVYSTPHTDPNSSSPWRGFLSDVFIRGEEDGRKRR